MKDKQRIDIILTGKGLAESREQAKRMVMAGCVYADNVKILKSAQTVNENSAIEVRGFEKEFVSRGGHKLKKAIETFEIILNNKTCADIGASTGGFTDCMLQNGAAKVYAVDTGYGQLSYKLRDDKRVVVMERFNARYLEKDTLNETVDFVSIDVSFISLRLIFPAVKKVLKPNGKIVCLIKPQFEAGREKVGKNGVVRDIKTHIEVIENVLAYAKVNGFNPLGLTYSPIKGPEGNIEYLLYLNNGLGAYQPDPKETADKAWSELSLC